MVVRKDKRKNNRTMIPTLQNNAAVGYQGPVKIELLKDAGLLRKEFGSQIGSLKYLLVSLSSHFVVSPISESD